MEINNTLAQLGLSKNEIAVYVHLLRNKSGMGAEGYRELNINKSSFYKALKSLETKNLVEVIGERRTQKFYASPTNNLKALHKNKTDEIMSLGKAIEDIVEKVSNSQENQYLSSNIQVYSGPDAYYTFMDQKIKNDVKLIRDITISTKQIHIMAGSKERYEKFVEQHINDRVKKGIKIKMLLDSSFDIDEKWQSSSSKALKEVRRYKGKLSGNSFLNIFGDKIGFMTIKANSFWGVIIKDVYFSSLLASMYDAIWEQSEEVK